ncbi:MAG: NfeD family protein [Halanaeroarchaeum sp.]
MVTLFGQSLSLVLFTAGVALCVMEALAPGAHFIVVGVALLVAGLLGLLVPSLATPLVLAGLVVVTGAGALLVYRRLEVYQGTDRGRTRSSRDLVGARGRVIERVSEDAGQVKLERGGFDSRYAARSAQGDIPEGSEVVVVDPGGGNVLTVEALDGADEIDRELARERARSGQPDPDHESERERDSA